MEYITEQNEKKETLQSKVVEKWKKKTMLDDRKWKKVQRHLLTYKKGKHLLFAYWNIVWNSHKTGKANKNILFLFSATKKGVKQQCTAYVCRAATKMAYDIP